MINKALALAIKAHHGQVDKCGKPYIFHLIRVALSLDDPTDKIIALLHDVVEDADVTLDDIENEFGSEIAHVIEKLTHRDSESYFDYIHRVGRNKTAIRVKIADLTDNLDPIREFKGRDNTKYKNALKYLSNL